MSALAAADPPVEPDPESDSDAEPELDWAALGEALSPGALAALREHVSAKDEANALASEGSVETLPTEDFGMSQFWWDDPSAEALGQEALDTGARSVAVLSAPSVYNGLQRLLRRRPEAHPGVRVKLLEFDARFEATAGSDFHQYDYAALEALPSELHGSFDYLLAGPPYMSLSCLDEYLRAFDLLGARGADTPASFVASCTLQEPLQERGLVMVEEFKPGYQSKLSNPMRLYRRNYSAPTPDPDAAAAAAAEAEAEAAAAGELE